MPPRCPSLHTTPKAEATLKSVENVSTLIANFVSSQALDIFRKRIYNSPLCKILWSIERVYNFGPFQFFHSSLLFFLAISCSLSVILPHYRWFSEEFRIGFYDTFEPYLTAQIYLQLISEHVSFHSCYFYFKMMQLKKKVNSHY